MHIHSCRSRNLRLSLPYFCICRMYVLYVSKMGKSGSSSHALIHAICPRPCERWHVGTVCMDIYASKKAQATPRHATRSSNRYANSPRATCRSQVSESVSVSCREARATQRALIDLSCSCMPCTLVKRKVPQSFDISSHADHSIQAYPPLVHFMLCIIPIMYDILCTNKRKYYCTYHGIPTHTLSQLPHLHTYTHSKKPHPFPLRRKKRPHIQSEQQGSQQR